MIDVNSSKILRYISFGMLAVMTALLALMTVGIHFGWSESLYTSWPMVALWALVAVSSLAMIFRARLCRKPIFLGIHLSFILILIGGCITHFCSQTETIHLRIGDSPVKIMDAPGIALQKFEIVTYPATATPRDYLCDILSENGRSARVSMNNPGNLMGYTYIIDSYDDDCGGVTFNVSHDVWGVGITYAGYIMLALSLIAYFFVKENLWRSSLRKLAAPLLLLVIFPADAKVSKDFAEDFGRTVVYYNGRICPMTTVAKDFTTTLTGGSASFKGYDMESVLAGFLFDFSRWKRCSVIKIKNRELREILGTEEKNVSYEQFFEAVSTGRIDLDNQETRRKFSADIDRFETVNMLVSGEILKLFPVSDNSGNISWLSPIDNIPPYIEGDQWLFIRKYLGLLNEQVQRGDLSKQKQLLEALRKYQGNLLSDELPSESEIRVEQLYIKLSSFRWPPILVGLAGICFFLLGIFNRKYLLKFRGIITAFAVVALLFLSVMFILRWIVSGHIPLSNGYETMQFLSWILLVIAVLFRNRQLILPMGILACGLAWGVAVLGGSGSSVSGLMPVLDSPLLSIHVMMVMASYALFLLMALTGVAGLININKDAPRSVAVINVMLYPAIALLAMGIFIGAVWANMSWGRYWGWDPKEVWALITLLIYSFAVHPRLLPWFSKPRNLMWFSILAFSSVLITYFGVNFFLGGLHSYA